MPISPPLKDLSIKLKNSGFYQGYNQTISIVSKLLAAIIVIWIIFDPTKAGDSLKVSQGWVLNNFNAFYTYAVAFFVIVCAIITIVPSFGKVKLGDVGGKPEFSNFSWFAMVFSAGIGIGVLTYSAAEPIWHLSSSPDIIMAKEQILAAITANGLALAQDADIFAFYNEQVASGVLVAIDGIVAPKSEEAIKVAFRYSFFHWGISAWATYSIIGICLAFFSYTRGLPLTIRSALTPIFGRRLEGTLGHIVDITAVIATILGIAQTIGLGLGSFASGLYNITGANWLMTKGDSPEPTIGALLACLFLVMIISTVSALSGVGRGIKWLSNTNIVLSFVLLAFFFIFGATSFSLNLLGSGLVDYVIHMPSMMFTVWDPVTELGQWQTGWSVYYWAWYIAFAPFVGTFLARISRNRSIREFALYTILAPSFMFFIWFVLLGGTGVDLELSGDANGRIFSSSLGYQLYEIINIMLGSAFAKVMSVVIVVLLLTYLVTSADSAILVINTINSGGDLNQKSGKKHIIIWSVVLTMIIGALLVAGGIGAIQSAMIVGTVPFSIIMILMGISLLKALIRDNLRSK